MEQYKTDINPLIAIHIPNKLKTLQDGVEQVVETLRVHVSTLHNNMDENFEIQTIDRYRCMLEESTIDKWTITAYTKVYQKKLM